MRIVKNTAVIMMFLVNVSFAQSITDYVILHDIGDYKFKTQTKDFITGQTRTVPGYLTRTAPGFLVGADHFDFDHDDKTYETKYVNRSIGLGVEVQVTKHTNSDSDKWLLHELEDSYRDNDNSDGRLGLLSGAGIKMREVGGNKFVYWGLGGGSYTWISGQKVIEIKYTDLQRSKPEPIEVVQAYLTKHPSTITLTDSDFKSQAHSIQWIKDEMDRRLWLCDKWFMQLQLKKVEEKQTYQESVKSMNIFLDYREKYYNIKAADDKNLLDGYLNTNNGTGIKAKLTEYKNWWSVNKTKAISL